jgi:hypothetical protein
MFDCLAVVRIARHNDDDQRRARKRAENKKIRPRADRQSSNLWAYHRAFHEPGDDCENGAAGTAAGDLTEERAEIQSAGAACEYRQQRLQRLTYDAAANRSRDRVAEHAEAIVLERCACCVATDRAGKKLNHENDQCFSHIHLQYLASPSINACALQENPSNTTETMR